MSTSIKTDTDAADRSTGGDGSQLPRWRVLTMAAAAGVAVANIYYNQPMLGVIERELPGGLAVLVPTATQLGYAIGLFLLVPLGDLLERRRIIVIQFGLLALALAGAAAAPSAALLVAASLLVGVAATVAQQIVPLAAHLAPPERRGAVLGTIMAGLLSGILLSRTLAGFVTAHLGWRAMFWIAVPISLGAALVMGRVLPRSRSDSRLSYAGLISSLAGLWRELPTLRRAAVTQGLIFAAFSVFWTILALRLQGPPFGYGAEIAGLFGIIGAVGVLAAPLAGRIADRSGARPVIVGGAVLTFISWVVFGAWPTLAGLILGTVLLDFASQSALVSHQHVIYALRPDARARINTIFMGAMFLAGSAGSALSTLAWSSSGWNAVCLLGGLLGLAAWLTARAGAKA